DHRRVEIGPHSVDGAASEVDHPAVPVVEPQSVLRRGQGVKFHDSLVFLHEQMLDDELSPVGQNLAELREGPGQKIRFRLVVTGQRMHAFDDPVDLVVYMLEKAGAIAVLKPRENLSDVVFGDHKLLLCNASNWSLDVGRTVLPRNLELSATFVQYMIEASVIGFGDGHGAAPHPIFSGCR